MLLLKGSLGNSSYLSSHVTEIFHASSRDSDEAAGAERNELDLHQSHLSQSHLSIVQNIFQPTDFSLCLCYYCWDHRTESLTMMWPRVKPDLVGHVPSLRLNNKLSR